MKKYLFISLFYSINIISVYAQLNKNPYIESGVFVCRANQYLIYMRNEQMDSERTTYTIEAINLNSNEKIVLDRQIRNKCVNISDTNILYIKGSDLILWNLKLKRKSVYYKTNKDMSIIGLSYNKNTSSLLLAQINLRKNELFIKILNSKKQIVYNQKIKLNELEMEGIIPFLDTSNNFFIFLLQDKLYTIDSRRLESKLVSSRCDGFALNNGKVVYYKFITQERTEGYSLDLITRENQKIDDLLNEKIYNCEKSFLFTANIDNSSIPTYTICKTPYLWVNNKWQLASEVFVYKDDKLIVKVPFEKNTIKDNCFQWELR
jgi:hypothetical protein